MAAKLVLVAGQGPAGLAAALSLAERGAEVLVVAPDTGPPDRAEMLPIAAEPILARLRLDEILGRSVQLSAVQSQWQSEDLVEVDGGLSLGGFGPGWSVERAELAQLMQARADDLGIQRLLGRVRSVSGKAGAWCVALVDGTLLSAACLIDTTGRPAQLARRLGARRILGPPLVAQVWSSNEQQPPLMQVEAAPDGWIYRLPRPGGGSSIGYLTGPEAEPRTLPQYADMVDARSQKLTPLTGAGWLAAGDAAIAFDPVASQGLFNAMSSGFFAGAAAADWCAGRLEALSVYAHLMERTAARTHARIPLQYAASRFQGPFWTRRAAHRDSREGITHRL